MKIYSYFSKNDKNKEPVSKGLFLNRITAAKWFSKRKCLKLKEFLQIFSISR